METRKELTLNEMDRISGGAGDTSGEERSWSLYYTVQKGDTLSLLARRYRTTEEEIMAKNHMTSKLLRLYTKIRLPR